MGVGHDAWTPTYKDEKVRDWLFKQQKGKGSTLPEVPCGRDRGKRFAHVDGQHASVNSPNGTYLLLRPLAIWRFSSARGSVNQPQ